jgi:iron(III) transport system permease protein
VPLIKPGFLSGFILLFIDYMKVLAIPTFLHSSNNQVLSVMIWFTWSQGYLTRAAALATIMIGMVALVYVVFYSFTGLKLRGL